MSVSTSAVTVTTTATALLALNHDRSSGLVVVPTGGATVYIGGSDVTTSNGIPVTAGNSFAPVQGHMADNAPAYAYFGIVASGTQDVRVMSVIG